MYILRAIDPLCIMFTSLISSKRFSNYGLSIITFHVNVLRKEQMLHSILENGYSADLKCHIVSK